MTRLLRVHDLVVVGLVATGGSACKGDRVSKESERAAERANEALEEVGAKVRAFDEHARAVVADAAAEIVDKANALSRANVKAEAATAEFEVRRAARVSTLRGVHSIAAAQPALINAVVTTIAHSESERARIVERLAVLEVRLDETGRLIEQLEHVEAKDWETRNAAIGDAMSRLKVAGDEAWDTLDAIAESATATG